jgi:large subunit ribosomal protein L7/L12
MALTKDDILDAISEMSVLELSELLTAFEEKFDVTAAAPVAAVAAAPADGGAAGAEEEKDSFDVVLTAAGDKKIQVIKEVRTLTNLGLRRPRSWWTAPPTTSSRVPRRTTPRRPRRPSRPPVARSSSSSTGPLDPPRGDAELP